MAIIVSSFWTPNNSGAVRQLTENLVGLRNVMREAGWTVDVASLATGGGGVQGETGLVIEFPTSEDYISAMDGDPNPKVLAHQQAIKTSDSAPTRSSTLVEIEGSEIAYGDLPRGLVQVSYIEPLPGKMPEAVTDVVKSQKIWGRIGIKVRAVRFQLGARWPVLAFMQFYESAQAWIDLTGALYADEEWNSHFSTSHENRRIFRQSAYRFMP